MQMHSRQTTRPRHPLRYDELEMGPSEFHSAALSEAVENSMLALLPPGHDPEGVQQVQGQLPLDPVSAPAGP